MQKRAEPLKVRRSIDNLLIVTDGLVFVGSINGINAQ